MADKEQLAYKQDPPFCVQVELVEGCNLRCSFCGLNSIRGKDNNLKFMTVETAKTIVQGIKDADWNVRIEFAMHGEPSLNPNMIEILKVFRFKLPRKTQLMMTSNGAGFMADPTTTIDAALKYLNCLALDWYENVMIVPKIRDRYRGLHNIIKYPQDPKGNPHRPRRPHDHELVIMQDITKATKGTHSHVNNHAGCGAPRNDRQQGKRCAKPFREIAVRWDGNVALCCNDWTGRFKAGNVHEVPLKDIWHSEAMNAARKKLYHGQRDFGPCDGCDAVSYRVGLLPDKYGRVKLPLPTSADKRAIDAALADGSYTPLVPREWHTEEDKRRHGLPLVTA